MVNRSDDEDEAIKELRTDLRLLKNVAMKNIHRAAVIAQVGDEEVAELLIAEAAVMMSVCHGVEIILDG